MPQYKIYKAMLSYGKRPVYMGEIWHTDLNNVKEQISNVMNLNPFYCIISDQTNKKIVKNEHCKISFFDLQKYNN